MAVQALVPGSDFVVVWKQASDAASGTAEPAPGVPGGIVLDASRVAEPVRILLPIASPAAAGAGDDLSLEVSLAAAEVRAQRPVQWIALLHGPSLRRLAFSLKLEALPVFGETPRRLAWTVAATSLPDPAARLFLGLQVMPGAAPLTLAARAEWRQARRSVASPAPLPAPEEPTPEEPAPEEPASEVAVPAVSAAEVPAPTAAAAPPDPADAAGPARPDQRLRRLPAGTLLVFKSVADAEACAVTPDPAAEGLLRLDLARCTQPVRLVRALPPPSGGVPPGIRRAFRLRLRADPPPGALTWIALTRGPTPRRLDLHRKLAPVVTPAPGAPRLECDFHLGAAEAAADSFFVTIQLAPGSGDIRISEPEIQDRRHLGALERRPDGGIELLVQPAAPGPLRLLAGRHDAWREIPLPEAAIRGGRVPVAEVERALGRAGWMDGLPCALVLLAGDLLADRLDLPTRPVRESGALTEASAHAIRGWAACDDQPELRPEVMVEVAGEAYITLQAAEGRTGGAFATRLLLGTDPDGDLVQLRSATTGRPLGAPMRLPPLPLRVRDPGKVASAIALGGQRRARASIVMVLGDGDAPLLPRSLAALLRHTHPEARLIAVEHGCARLDLRQALDAWARRRPLELVRAAEGLSLAAATDLGMEAAGHDDVALLPAGAVVGPRWLQRLRLAAHRAADIASASALDALPEGLVPAAWDGSAAARLAMQASGGLFPVVPAMGQGGVFLRRDAWAAVGPFDAPGLSEEAEWRAGWSMRARYAGFRHLLDEGCLIAHAPPAGDQPAVTPMLGHRYPELPALRARHRTDPAPATARHRIATLGRRAAAGLPPRARCLFVVSTLTGGTPQTNRDLMRALAPTHDPLLLQCDGRVMTLLRPSGEGDAVLERHELGDQVDVLRHRSAEYDEVVADWLVGHAVELVHVRHLAWHSLGLVDAARALGIPVVMSFHDFYAVCPTVKLLDGEMTPCGGVCTAGEGACRPDLWPRDAVPPLRDRWVHNWRAMMRRPLDGCSAYVASSAGAKETLLRAFPDLAARRFEVIPHGRDFGHLDRAFLPSRQPGEVLRVLLPGNISRAKGAEIIAQLAELDCEERFEFHVLGDCANSLKRARVFLHGPYEREEFPAIVERIRPHLGAVLSLWPETWSHTLTELWSVGLPVLAFDLGAQGERIRESGCGWLVAERTAEAVHALLVELQGSDGPHAAARRAVEAWRSGPARQESVPAMAARYAALYASLLESGPVEDAAPVAAVEHAA